MYKLSRRLLTLVVLGVGPTACLGLLEWDDYEAESEYRDPSWSDASGGNSGDHRWDDDENRGSRDDDDRGRWDDDDDRSSWDDDDDRGGRDDDDDWDSWDDDDWDSWDDGDWDDDDWDD